MHASAHRNSPGSGARAGILLALMLAGCAQLPTQDRLVQPRPASAYQAAASLQAPPAPWPLERWWTAYGDAQLDTLIDEALRDSPDLQAVAARLRRAEAFSQVAGAPLLPQVSAAASISEQKLSYNHLTPRAITPQGWNDYGRLSVDLGWELDFWGRNRAGLAAATSELEAYRAEQAQARLNLAAAVTAGYADLAQWFAVRDTVAATVALRRRAVVLFSLRFDNGLETRGSLYEAKGRLASAEGELLSVDEQIGLARNRLAALLGAGPDRGLVIQRPDVMPGEGVGLPQALAADLLGRRPDVVAARRMVEALDSRILQKKADFYPNVNLTAFIGLQSLGLDMLSKGGSSIGGLGPAISLPIFTGGRLRGELKGAEAAREEAVANYNRTVTQALQEVASAGLSQKALAAQLEKGRAAVAAAGETHRVARNRHEGGLANALEVLYAEDAWLGSQRSLTLLQARALSLDVALKRALGGGYQAGL